MAGRTRRNLPPGRSLESLRHHYEVEREIASRLRRASRPERPQLYATMYDELFERVPDHPRRLRRNDPARTRAHNRSKLTLLEGFLAGDRRVAEFAPGDCRFCLELCNRTQSVTGIDISDQRGEDWAEEPGNFRLVLYDGYQLDLPDACVDLVFSDQLVEHLHPDDTQLHFRLVRRILAPEGTYVFRTPHALCGPHDVSQFFSDVPEGFHLREWTYHELEPILREAGFGTLRAFWNTRGTRAPLPWSVTTGCERVLGVLPPEPRRRLSRLLLPNVTVAASR